jgi:hypothetical protein
VICVGVVYFTELGHRGFSLHSTQSQDKSIAHES